jgi:hypothetical protein
LKEKNVEVEGNVTIRDVSDGDGIKSTRLYYLLSLAAAAPLLVLLDLIV